MKLFAVAIVVASFFTINVNSFAKPFEANISIGKEVILNDPQVKEVFAFWTNYLNSHPDSSYDNPYWNSAEKARYPKADLFRSWNTHSDLYANIGEYKPMVLSISHIGDYFKIRTLFPGQIAGRISDSLAITDIYAKKTNGKFELYNALAVNTKDWQHHTIGSITFICPQYHVFDERLAMRLDRFADSLAARFGETPKHVDYYFADTYAELTRARGFEYISDERNDLHPQGYSEVRNGIVTASGLGEFYPHEFVHMYAFPQFPKADVMLHEGLATYIGGSHGHTLDWMIKDADSLLRVHPDLDINAIFADNRNVALDNEVGADYLFGGIIVKIVYEKGGWNWIQKLLTYGPTPQEGRFAVLKDFFHIQQKDAGTFMRTMIAVYAQKPVTVKPVLDIQ